MTKRSLTRRSDRIHDGWSENRFEIDIFKGTEFEDEPVRSSWSPTAIRRSYRELEADPDCSAELIEAYRRNGGRPFKYHPLKNPGRGPWLAVMEKMIADNDPEELADNRPNLVEYWHWQARNRKYRRRRRPG